MECAFAHIRGRFLGLWDEASGELVGGLPVYVVRSRLLGNRLVTAPFATYCDPLLRAPSDLLRLWPLLNALRLEVGARQIRVKARASFPAVADLGFRQTDGYLHHYLPLVDDPAHLMKCSSRTNVRQWIRRATNAGLTVDRCHDEIGAHVFYPMFVRTRRRLGLPWVPYAFFDGLNQNLGPERLSWFLARKDEVPVAGVLALHFKDTLILESLGEGEAAHGSGAVQLIFWTAIEQACLERYRFVSFGRTEKENRGLAAHKRCWGCVEETLADYCYPPTSVCSPRELMQGAGRRWIGSLLQAGPVSVGSALGQFFYRHWA